MKISQLNQLPYPPYRVTNMDHINYVISISDINYNKYVHPCKQLRRSKVYLGHTVDPTVLTFFAEVWYNAAALQLSNGPVYGTVQVEYEYI